MAHQRREAREDLLKKTDTELRAMLMQELASDDIRADYINEISEILEQRHPEEHRYNDEGIWEAVLQVCEEDKPAKPKAKKPKMRRTLRSMAAIAAVLAVVVTSALTIPVRGTNLWTLIADWTEEVFSLGPTELDKAENNMLTDGSADSLALYDYMVNNGVTTPLAPKYIPAEFEKTSIICKEFQTGLQKYCAEFENSDGTRITITIRNYSDPDSILEKDGTDVQTCVYAGITHYIMQNLDSVTISWKNDVFNCNIAIYSSSFPEEEIEHIIKSIYD